MLCKPKIKICGLTSEEEVKWVVREGADYAGFVLFFPKSKRNLTREQAGGLLEALALEKSDRGLLEAEALGKSGRGASGSAGCEKTGKGASPPYSVAVVVSPTPEQVGEIKELGFDYIQIHGTISAETLKELDMPLIRAINVGMAGEAGESAGCCGEALTTQIEERVREEKRLFGERLFACLFDAAEPGSGKVFDWKLLSEIRTLPLPFFLAGGLNPHNVGEAVRMVRPDAVDVSSGVEKSEETVGKDRAKIKEFIRKVRTDE